MLDRCGKWLEQVGRYCHWVGKYPLNETDSPFHTIPFNLIVSFPNNYPEARPTITF